MNSFIVAVALTKGFASGCLTIAGVRFLIKSVHLGSAVWISPLFSTISKGSSSLVFARVPHQNGRIHMVATTIRSADFPVVD